MFIKNIELVNFKSYLRKDISFSTVTLLTGLNGSGKSSVFQSLRMFWNHVLNNEILINELGKADSLKNKNSKERKFEINVTSQNDEKNNIAIDLDIPLQNTIDRDLFHDYLFSYISAERWGPREHLPLRNTLQEKFDVGQFGEFTLDILSKHEEEAIPEELMDEYVEKNSLLKFVERWIKEISPNISIQSSKNDKMNTASLEVNHHSPVNVGFGISYTLPIIVQMAYSAMLSKSGKKCIVLIENPEAHLHPKGQTKIAEFIAKIANYGVQVIIETHSDYVLDGLRLAIKNNFIHNESIKIHFCTLDQEQNTEIQTPSIGKDGLLDAWPEDFFDVSIKNRMQLM